MASGTLGCLLQTSSLRETAVRFSGSKQTTGTGAGGESWLCHLGLSDLGQVPQLLQSRFLINNKRRPTRLLRVIGDCASLVT